MVNLDNVLNVWMVKKWHSSEMQDSKEKILQNLKNMQQAKQNQGNVEKKERKKEITCATPRWSSANVMASVVFSNLFAGSQSCHPGQRPCRKVYRV